jgi:glycosyltransferase involved in cell wall biosynthesis
LSRRRIAVVIQRYGAGITGGSESLAKAVCERLVPEMDVTVFTTRARDYVTWRNDLPEGEGVENGVRVIRFSSEEERDLEAFNRYADSLYGGTPSRDEEQLWLRRQGPYVPRLLEALRAQKGDFDAFLFFTYLYYPTLEGLKVCPERSVLVPTAHDEPPLRFSIFDDMFARPRALAFCSGPEEALVRSRFPIAPEVRSEVTGIGIDVPEGSAPRSEGAGERFLLYAGRIDAGKGCDAMVRGYLAYRSRRPGGPRLDLIGNLAMELPADASVRYRGFVSEDLKQALLRGADLVLCPSPFESLSITLLEGFACGTPVLANAVSPVLKDHCIRSNGGLYYETQDEFVEALDLLVRDADLRRSLGQNGLAYVRREYTWDTVLMKYRRLLESVSPT